MRSGKRVRGVEIGDWLRIGSGVGIFSGIGVTFWRQVRDAVGRWEVDDDDARCGFRRPNVEAGEDAADKNGYGNEEENPEREFATIVECHSRRWQLAESWEAGDC